MRGKWGRGVIFYLTLFCPSIFSITPTSPPLRPDIDKTDQLFKLRKIKTNAFLALESYRVLYDAEPQNTEIAWRLAMACEFVGFRHTAREEDRRILFAEGREAGLAAAKINPQCAPCHFWAGINMALYGDSVGAFKTILTLPEVRRLLIRSSELDPAYAFGGAFRVLGLIEQKLPGILGGSDRRAEEYFRKAVATASQEPLNILTLAQHLIEHRDKPQEGIAILKKGALEVRAEPGVPESEDSLSELNAYYQKWVPREAHFKP